MFPDILPSVFQSVWMFCHICDCHWLENATVMANNRIDRPASIWLEIQSHAPVLGIFCHNVCLVLALYCCVEINREVQVHESIFYSCCNSLSRCLCLWKCWFRHSNTSLAPCEGSHWNKEKEFKALLPVWEEDRVGHQLWMQVQCRSLRFSLFYK